MSRLSSLPLGRATTRRKQCLPDISIRRQKLIGRSRRFDPRPSAAMERARVRFIPGRFGILAGRWSYLQRSARIAAVMPGLLTAERRQRADSAGRASARGCGGKHLRIWGPGGFVLPLGADHSGSAAGSEKPRTLGGRLSPCGGAARHAQATPRIASAGRCFVSCDPRQQRCA